MRTLIRAVVCFCVVAMAACTAAPKEPAVRTLRDKATVVATGNAKLSHYGHYLQAVLTRFQKAWDATPRDSLPKAEVALSFTLRPNGAIENIRPDTGAPTALREAALATLTPATPLPAWSDDMKARLGNRTELTIIFRNR